MHALDWTIIAIYIVAQLGIGLRWRKSASDSVENFFLAGRKLSWWLLGTSMVASAFASDTPLFITNLVRRYGVSGAWYYWNASLNGLFAAFFIAYLWRRTRVMSDAEFRELRYSGRPGKAVRAAWALFWTSLTTFFTSAWIILAMVKICKVVFGLSDTVVLAGHELHTSVVVVAVSLAVAATYSSLSGLWGIIVTDFVQFVLAYVGTFTLAALAVRRVGGLHALRSGIAALPAAGPRFLDVIPTAGHVLVVFWVGLTVQWWASSYVDGGMMMAQRSLAAKSEKHAEIGRFWGHLAQMGIIVWPWAVTALCSLILLPAHLFPEVARDPEAAYPMMVIRVLPTGVRGIVVAGLFAAFMSSICTILNMNASYLVNDVYRRFLVRRAEPHHYVLMGRLATVAIMAVGGYMATVSTSVLGLSELMFQFTGGVGAVFVLRWLWWRINAWSEIAAYLSSGTLGIALNTGSCVTRLHGVIAALAPASSRPAIDAFFLVVLPGPEGWAYRLAAIAVATTVIALAATLLTPPTEKEHLLRFYRRVKPYGPGWARIRREFGPNVLDAGQLPFDWKRLAAGAAFFFSVFFMIGKLSLGDWTGGAIATALATVSGWALFRRWFRIEDGEDAEPAADG